MISWMQKHRKYLVITIWISTIAFVGAGFVGWGAYKFGANSSDTIAKVGDIEITNKDFQIKYSNVYNIYNQMLGGSLTKEKAKQLRLTDIALKQLFEEALLENYAKDMGLIVTQKEVLKEIANTQAFFVDGKFSESKYNAILQRLGMDSEDFKNQIKKSLLVQKILDAIDLPLTKLEKNSFLAAFYMEDKIKYKIIKNSDSNITLSENEIKDFWEKNKQKYKTQKLYTVDIIKVKANDFNASEDEIKEFYNKKRYLFKDQTGKILPFDKAYEKVKKEVQFKKAKKAILKKYVKLKNQKISAEKTLNISSFNPYIPMQKLQNAKKGDYLKAVKTPDGYLCAYIKDIKDPKVMPYEEAKKYAKADLLKQKQEENLKQLAKNALKNFEKLDELKTSSFLNKNSIDKVTFLPKSEAINFLNYLFSMKVKKSFYIFLDQAMVFEITDQKLFDEKEYQAYINKIENEIHDLKKSTIRQKLLQRLEKRYKIEKYFTQKDQS